MGYKILQVLTMTLAMGVSSSLVAEPMALTLEEFFGPETVIDFNDIPNTQPITDEYISAGVEFSGALVGLTSLGDTSDFNGSTIASNWIYGAANDPGANSQGASWEATFDTIYQRVGFFSKTNTGDSVTIEAFLGATSIGSLNFPKSDGVRVEFLGLGDIGGFDRVRVTTADNDNGFFAMDDFRFGVVPEVLPLQGRLPATPGGTDFQAYYDPNLDITWAADANPQYPNTTDWNNGIAWAETLTISGVSGWRVPNADVNGDGTVVDCSPGGVEGCEDNEMGFLYWEEGIAVATPDPFININDDGFQGPYWFSTESSSIGNAWVFVFGDGIQETIGKDGIGWVWPVHDGDVGLISGSAVGGSVTGMIPQTIRCENRETRQRVSVPLPDDGAWNCEEAGLVFDTDDRIAQRVTGIADGTASVGGTVTGVSGTTARCDNTSTGRRVFVDLNGGNTWDCEDAGLRVRTGDSIAQLVTGTADQIPPPVSQVVSIDIQPDDDKNRIDLVNHTHVSVAILTDSGFDALEVDPTSVRFGPGEAASSVYRSEDSDGDSDIDLRLRFRLNQTGIACGDTEATLTGATFGGQQITGTDSIEVICDSDGFTPWLSGSEYQAEFDSQAANSHYPIEVEGRNFNGQSQFRGKFVPFQPTPFAFFSYHNQTQASYESINSDLLTQGFSQIFLQTFVDQAGIRRYQATWTQT